MCGPQFWRGGGGGSFGETRNDEKAGMEKGIWRLGNLEPVVGDSNLFTGKPVFMILSETYKA